MRKAALPLAIALTLGGCHAGTPAGGGCSRDRYANDLQGPRADGATCRGLDPCNGTCPGVCGPRCATNPERPAACLCSGILSPETAGGRYCEGTACVP